MAKFEAHITCPAHASNSVKDVGEIYGWKFSCITGDALLGDKPYCYLTRYEPDVKTLNKEMIGAVVALAALDVLVIRQKIERIIYDTKTGVNELT